MVRWLDDITQWSGKRLVDIVRLAENRDQYRRFVFEAANARSPGTVNFQYLGRRNEYTISENWGVITGTNAVCVISQCKLVSG